MIVRDEEAALGDCLRSVQGFADELVVVDTGSTDATVAIAEAAGARVERDRPGRATSHRPATRPWSFSTVTGCWCWTPMSSCVPRGHPGPEGVDGSARCAGDQPAALRGGAAMAPYSSVSRLFRRHPSIQWSRPYHSMIDDSVRTRCWRRSPNGASPIAVSRRSFTTATDRSCWRAATRRIGCGKPWKSDLQDRPGDPYASAKLGGLLISEGKTDQAIPLAAERPEAMRCSQCRTL